MLAALDLLTGLTLLVAGAMAWHGRPRSRVGLLLVATSACWFVGGVVGAFGFVLRGPLVQLHVSYPTGLHKRLKGFEVPVGGVLVERAPIRQSTHLVYHGA